MYTIEDLKNGKCAVENNGSLKELQKVLKLAFPNSNMDVRGTAKYYLQMQKNSLAWDCFDSPSSVKVPIQSVKDFLQPQPQFKRGEKVMVRDYDSQSWMNRVYLTTVPELAYPHICVEGGQEKKIVELTLQEISEKTGIPVHLIRIKD